MAPETVRLIISGGELRNDALLLRDLGAQPPYQLQVCSLATMTICVASLCVVASRCWFGTGIAEKCSCWSLQAAMTAAANVSKHRPPSFMTFTLCRPWSARRRTRTRSSRVAMPTAPPPRSWPCR